MDIREEARLKYADGVRLRDIAKELDIPYNTVVNWACRGSKDEPAWNTLCEDTLLDIQVKEGMTFDKPLGEALRLPILDEDLQIHESVVYMGYALIQESLNHLQASGKYLSISEMEKLLKILITIEKEKCNEDCDENSWGSPQNGGQGGKAGACGLDSGNIQQDQVAEEVINRFFDE